MMAINLEYIRLLLKTFQEPNCFLKFLKLSNILIETIFSKSVSAVFICPEGKKAVIFGEPTLAKEMMID